MTIPCFGLEYEGLTEHYKENSGGLITDPDGDKVKMRWCSKSDDRQATEGLMTASCSQYLSHSQSRNHEIFTRESTGYAYFHTRMELDMAVLYVLSHSERSVSLTNVI